MLSIIKLWFKSILGLMEHNFKDIWHKKLSLKIISLPYF